MGKDQSDFEEFKTALGLHIDDPWERVKTIFVRGKYGDFHPDLNNALESAQMSFLGAAVIGGFFCQREYLQKIKERSDANVYHNRMDAYRQLSQESLKGFLQGAFRWGPRVAVFVGGFSLFASCVEAYRNKSGIIEYVMGGSMVGGILRSNFGVRGMLVGSLVGSVLGTIYGIVHLGMLKLTNTDSVQIKYAQYAFSKYLDERAAATFKAKGEHTKIVSRVAEPSTSDFLSPLNNVKVLEEQPKKQAEEKS